MHLKRLFLQGFRFQHLNRIVLSIYYLIHIISAQSPCDGTTQLNVTRTKQYLTTPFYGQANYPPKMDCFYVLVAEPGNRILVEILNMDMEAQIFRSCLDYIGFYEGKQERYSRPYLTFCGQLQNRQVTSQGSSLTIRFFSDEIIEGKGAKLTYEAVAFGECDAGWLSKEDGNCYRYVEAYPRVGWAEAQEQCSQMQSNLAQIRDERDFEFLDKAYGHSSAHAWIGYTDADEEGNLKGVDSKSNAIWPKPALSNNADVRDCLYLDYSHSGDESYQLADCRTKQTFICQKHNNWSTVAVESQKDRIRRGSLETSTGNTIWLLILVLLILLTILLCIAFQACLKKRDRNRVSSSESNRLVHGSESGPVHVNEMPVKSHRVDEINYQKSAAVDRGAASHRKAVQAVQMPHVQDEVHASPVEMTLVPAKELPKLVDDTETKILETANLTTKEQQPSTTVVNVLPARPPPRSLPPLSIHDTTLQSMNTRDESFLRSKRSSVLFDRPKMNVLENVSAISLDEFWSNTKN
ncbi:unnamed protein product [Cylicocyclus nassatus]|uniref:Uncharacterized protein n=1 Tax=Cylicocyclus nassatus TaxID=53992 RepID=A0AA36HH37_CYLNA|nr:unnamed protein product [Cylicocyclus nassatus]